MFLTVEPYLEQQQHWPKLGRHILAHYDEETIVVYQAYRASIGKAAVADQRFGGGNWSFGRMSWIKPNFLWMMFRCGWATKAGQEVVLAVHLRRSAFDELLRQAALTSYSPEIHGTVDVWKHDLAQSNVRLQWDPDHSPTGERLERRAIQIGLQGPVLAAYAADWVVKIEDVSEFVREQRVLLDNAAHEPGPRLERLMTPRERVYPVRDKETSDRILLSDASEL